MFQPDIEKFKKSKGPVSGRSLDLFDRLDFSEQAQFNGGARSRKGLKLAVWQVSSAFIDGLLILSLSCLFIVVAMLTLKVSGLNKLLTSTDFKFFIGFLFLVTTLTYFTACRLFVGATAGEYSCSLRLGQPSERLKKDYVLRVLLRTLIIICTGIIPLPLVSLILGYDIPGIISKVSIYSLK